MTASPFTESIAARELVRVAIRLLRDVELAALRREVVRLERAHLARPGAVDLRNLAQFECARHCETSIG
jgi:hypothetical protein